MKNSDQTYQTKTCVASFCLESVRRLNEPDRKPKKPNMALSIKPKKEKTKKNYDEIYVKNFGKICRRKQKLLFSRIIPEYIIRIYKNIIRIYNIRIYIRYIIRR